MRPAQWAKNGLLFAGLMFGAKLNDPLAVATAILAAVAFCFLSSGFYLINDVRDVEADRLHPEKRRRPVAAGEIAPRSALVAGAVCVVAALALAAVVGAPFLAVCVAYAALMATYNLGLKGIVILDVFAIAAGFALRAVGGAVAVAVSISSWLLICTVLLALFLGFGKRRYELVALLDAGGHRRNLDQYTRPMLDQAIAVTAAGTLVAYAIYAAGITSAPLHRGMMLTIPFVAYGIFRYLFLLYRRAQGGDPEIMLFSDRGLLATVVIWAALSVWALYFGP